MFTLPRLYKYECRVNCSYFYYENTFLFTPGDLDECVRKIEQLLSSKVLRESIGRAAREEMEKCDWRAASKTIRNEHYCTATLYWRKKMGRTN